MHDTRISSTRRRAQRSARLLAPVAGLGMVLLSAAPAIAGQAATSGTTVGGPTYNRQGQTDTGQLCTAPSPPASVAYATRALSVDATGAYDIYSQTTGYDGFIFLYESPFDPSAPAVRCLKADDDEGNQNNSAIFGAQLVAGTAYTLVQTAYSNGGSGPFTLTVSGPGNVAFAAAAPAPVIPEVPYAALLPLAALGTAGLVVASRRPPVAGRDRTT